MNSVLATLPRISVEDYLEGELVSEIRHEFVDGQVYAMSGASDRHGLIVNALAFAMTPAARRRTCQLFTSDLKVYIKFAGKDIFYYPDLLLSCDTDDRETYFRRRPCLIVEVLSRSTARIDRHEKLQTYQSLESLQEYLLVAQDRRRVEVFRRATGWQGELVEQGAIWLDCLDMDISMDEIYADVDFAPGG